MIIRTRRSSLTSQTVHRFKLGCAITLLPTPRMVRLLSWIETESLVDRYSTQARVKSVAWFLRRCKCREEGRGSMVPQDVRDQPCGPTMATRSRNVGYSSTNGSWHALLPIPKTFPSAFFAPSSTTWVVSAPRGGEGKGEDCLEKLPYLNPAVGIPGHLNRGGPNHLNASKGAFLILHWRRTKGCFLELDFGWDWFFE